MSEDDDISKFEENPFEDHHDAEEKLGERAISSLAKLKHAAQLGTGENVIQWSNWVLAYIGTLEKRRAQVYKQGRADERKSRRRLTMTTQLEREAEEYLKGCSAGKDQLEFVIIDFIAGWRACRAAMLNLPSGEILDLETFGEEEAHE